MGTSAVLGLLAKAKFDSANDDGHCDANGCDAEGLRIQRDAIKRGNVATIVFGAGAALTATGVILWLKAPKHEASLATPWAIGIAPDRVQLRASF